MKSSLNTTVTHPVFALLVMSFLFAGTLTAAVAQDGEAGAGLDAGAEMTLEEPAQDAVGDANGMADRMRGAVDEAKEKVTQFAQEVDKNESANEAKAGVLKPIYSMAEAMSFSAFHWLAFMLMITGVVSYALQLVLGKLMVLTKLGFSLTEILSDALGLVISLIGLVLTTQAATENSTFTESAFAVLSATILGFVLGLVFYIWGQNQELQAVAARSAKTAEVIE